MSKNSTTCTSCSRFNSSRYKSLCSSCYQKQWRKTIPKKRCYICDSMFHGSGKTCKACLSAGSRKLYKQKPCCGCGRNNITKINIKKGLCSWCHDRAAKGLSLGVVPKAPKMRWRTPEGYIKIKNREHPNSDKKRGCISEHSFVMSQYLGRPLTTKETVHHKNGIRDDNRIENLELWDSKHPPGQRVEDKIKFFALYLNDHGYTISASVSASHD